MKSETGITTVMPEAISVRVEGDKIRCVDIIGRETTVDSARISEIDLLRHRIILERF